MKKSAVIRIIVWSVVAVILTALLVSAIAVPTFRNFGSISLGGNSFNYYYDDESLYSIGAGEFDAENINSIDISWISGLVQIVPYDGDTVRLEETDNAEENFKLRYRIVNNCLVIKPCASKRFLFGNIGGRLNKELTVCLPQKLADTLVKIDIKTASSDVNIESVKIGEIDIETASGNATVENLQCTKLDIETVSGDVRGYNVTASQVDNNSVSGNHTLIGAFSKIDVESVSGTIKVNSSEALSSVDIETVSGDVDITIPETDFCVDFDTVSGDLTSEFPFSLNGKIKTYGKGIYKYSFETVSGDVTINRANEKTESGVGNPVSSEEHTAANTENNVSQSDGENVHVHLPFVDVEVNS